MADQQSTKTPDISELKLVELTINDEIRDKCKRLCSEYLSGPWSDLKPDEIDIEPVPDGLSNRIYVCTNLKLPQCKKSTLKSDGSPSKVLIRLHGSEFVGDQGDMIVVPKEALPLMCEILYQKGLAAKIYGVFNEGRIEHFVESTKFPPESWSDQRLLDCLTRKLVEIHQLEIPVSKNRWSLIEMAEKAVKTARETNQFLDINLYDLDLQPMIKQLLEFDHDAEAKWLRDMEPYIKSPCVFCHNDLHFGNVLNREIGDSLDDQVFIIDYDNSSYGFRAYDIALFLYLKSFVPGRIETWSLQKITTPEEKKHTIHVYLDHLKKVRKGNIDPETDTFENLERELDFGSVLVNFTFSSMGLTKMNPMLARIFVTMFEKMKDNEIEVELAKIRCEQYKRKISIEN